MSNNFPENHDETSDPDANARKGGRPRKGADKAHGHVVYMDDALWAYCRSQPEGASVFLKQLASEHQERQEEPK